MCRQYNPWTVYGDPVTPYPGFSLLGAIGSFFSSAAGTGVAVWGGDRDGGVRPYAVRLAELGGELAGARDILFNHSAYPSHSNTVANWGLPRGGMLAFAGSGAVGGRRGGYARAGVPMQGYARPAERNSYSAPVERAYAPVERYNRPEAQAYNRPTMEAYNRTPAPISRPQAYSSPQSRLALWAELLQRRRGI